jgi:hypothetical protein
LNPVCEDDPKLVIRSKATTVKHYGENEKISCKDRYLRDGRDSFSVSYYNGKCGRISKTTYWQQIGKIM